MGRTPPGWGTRAEAVFSSRTPTHLIAATAAAMTDPRPVVRERHTINHAMERLVTLTPLRPPIPGTARTPTPLDIRRTAVTQAIHRATRAPQTGTELRIQAARSRTTTASTARPHNPQQAPEIGPPAGNPPTAPHKR